MAGGCRLRSERGRLLVCGGCFVLFSMRFMVVVAEGNGGGAVAVVFCGFYFLLF